MKLLFVTLVLSLIVGCRPVSEEVGHSVSTTKMDTLHHTYLNLMHYNLLNETFPTSNMARACFAWGREGADAISNLQSLRQEYLDRGHPKAKSVYHLVHSVGNLVMATDGNCSSFTAGLEKEAMKNLRSAAIKLTRVRFALVRGLGNDWYNKQLKETMSKMRSEGVISRNEGIEITTPISNTDEIDSLNSFEISL